MTTQDPGGSNKPQLKVLLCSPRGFCAGVVRAIDSVEQALKRYGAPVYVRHEIVHNRYVVESLKTPPAPWSPRCTARPRSISSAAAKSC